MAGELRSDTIQRQDRVKQFAIEHMLSGKGGFPTGRQIHQLFLENQLPGNLNSITADMKAIASDIALVHEGKKIVKIGGAQTDIPDEVFSFAVQAYNAIEVKGREKYDNWKEEHEFEMQKLREELSDLISENKDLSIRVESQEQLLQQKDITVRELRDEKNKKEVELTNLRANHASVSQEKIRYESDYNNTFNELKELKTSSRETIKTLTEKHTETLNTLKIQYEQDLQLSNERFEEKEDILANDYQERLSEKQSYLDELQDKNNTLDRKLQKLQDTHEQTIRDVTSSEAIRKQLEQQLLEMDEKYSDLQMEMDNALSMLENEKSELQANNAGLTEQVGALKAVNDGILEERSVHKKEIVELKSVIQVMSNKLSDLEKKFKNE